MQIRISNKLRSLIWFMALPLLGVLSVVGVARGYFIDGYLDDSDVLYEQVITSSAVSEYYCLDGVSTGDDYVASMTFSIDATGASETTDLFVTIIANDAGAICTGSTTSASVVASETLTGVENGTSYVTFEFDTPFQLNASTPYLIVFGEDVANTTSTHISIRGTEAGNGFADGYDPNSANTDWFFALDTSLEPSVTGDTTNRVTLTSPTTGSVVTTPVTFSGRFYSDGNTSFSTGAFQGVRIYATPTGSSFGPWAPVSVLVPETAIQDFSDAGLMYDWEYTQAFATGTSWRVEAQLMYGEADLYRSDPIYIDIGTSYIPSEEDSIECGIMDIAGCLQLAIQRLFYPEPSAVERFKSLTLRNSAPFSYVYDVENLWNKLFAGGGSMEYAVSADTPLGEFDFISASQIEAVPYASTIKTILGYLLYLFTAYTVYRRVLSVHNR